MARAPQIAIIGGGIGGLAAARALMLRGIEVAVYEQASQLSEFGGGVVTTPNAVKALRGLGVEDAAFADAFVPARQTVLSWRSGRVIDRARLEPYREKFGAPFCTMHRGDLLETLHRAVGDSVIRLGARCVAVEADGRGAAARFADGSAIEADAIVGADGIHSAVRTSLFGPERPRFTGYVCWRGLVPVDRLPAGLAPPDMTAWWGPHGHVVHYHVRRGELLNWVAHTETDAWTEESWSREGDLDEVGRTYARWNRRLLDVFAATERCYKWALYDREPLARWSVGRATLLGDSAHAMLPYLAQGAAQSLEDACVLAAEIAARPDDVAGALQAYETVRIPRTRRIQLGSRARGRDNHLPSAWARLKRDARLALRRWLAPDTALHRADWIFSYDAADHTAGHAPDQTPGAAA
jgi:salicylate hydroxylase